MKQALLLLVFSVILCGCTHTPSGGASFLSSESSASGVNQSNVVEPFNGSLHGEALETLGYQVVVPTEAIVASDKPVWSWSTAFGVISQDENYNRLLDGKGNYTPVSVNFFVQNGSEPLTIMCLQAFNPSDIQTDSTLKIGDVLYTFEALRPYLVFQNKEIAVYDVYQFADGRNLSDLISAQLELWNKPANSEQAEIADERFPEKVRREPLTFEEYAYLLDIEDYYRKNIQSLIVKQGHAEPPISSEAPTSVSEPDYVFENPSMNPDGTYSSSGLYSHTRELTEKMMAHLRSTLDKSAYGGIYFGSVPSAEEPVGINILTIWVVEKDVVQSAIDSYPSEKCEIRFKETEYSLKNFETVQQDVEQMEIFRAFKVHISIYENQNRISIFVPTEDEEALGELRVYIEGSPLKEKIRLTAQSGTNPDM